MQLDGQLRARAAPLHLVADTAYTYGAIALNPSGHTAASQSIVGRTLQVSAGFVAHLYRDVLDRAVDPAGSALYNGLLQGGQRVTDVAARLLDSNEYRSAMIDQLYLVALHRHADPDGMRLASNLIGSGSTWEQIQSRLMGSNEYYSSRAGTNNGNFVAAAYMDALQRPPDSAGAAHWLAQLDAGVSRETVAQALLLSSEGLAVRINSWYQKYLHRPADSTGLTSSTNALQNGARDEQIITRLITSDEYLAAV